MLFDFRLCSWVCLIGVVLDCFALEVISVLFVL